MREIQCTLDLFKNDPEKFKVYNLRIVLPEAVYSEILQFKNEFIPVFGKQPLSKSKPHCTVAAFIMNPVYEPKMFQAFHQLSNFQ